MRLSLQDATPSALLPVVRPRLGCVRECAATSSGREAGTRARPATTAGVQLPLRPGPLGVQDPASSLTSAIQTHSQLGWAGGLSSPEGKLASSGMTPAAAL